MNNRKFWKRDETLIRGTDYHLKVMTFKITKSRYPQEIQEIIDEYAPNGVDELDEDGRAQLAVLITQKNEELNDQKGFWGKLWLAIKPIVFESVLKLVEILLKPKTK